MFPDLPKAYKGRFPFRLGTTSFIYPAGYWENAHRLAPFLDEIELILFESRELPDSREIRGLNALSSEFGLSFNVHLPLDIFLGSPDPAERRRSVHVLMRIFDLTAPLEPTSWTLHLNIAPEDHAPGPRKRWQERVVHSIQQLQKSGISKDRLGIENLDYPVDWMEAVRDECGLGVCMDFGHLLVNRTDPMEFFLRNCNHINMIHLHGVDGRRDHRSLGLLPTAKINWVVDILRNYRGSVSIEVFGFEALQSSLAVLDTLWDSPGGGTG